MTIKEDLHQLVEQLTEGAADELLDYARWLKAEEDAALDEEQLAGVEIGESELRRGESIVLEELHRQLGQ